MSTDSQEIECRQCRETIPADAGACPNCGTSVRSFTIPVAVAILGLILGVASLSNLEALWFYGLIGLVMVAVSSTLIFDRRRRQKAV